MRYLFISILLLVSFTPGLVAQNQSDDLIQRLLEIQKMQKEFGLLDSEPNIRPVLGLVRVVGPLLFEYHPDGAPEIGVHTAYGSTIRSSLVLNESIDLVEIEPDKIGAIFQELSQAQAGFTDRDPDTQFSIMSFDFLINQLDYERFGDFIDIYFKNSGLSETQLNKIKAEFLDTRSSSLILEIINAQDGSKTGVIISPNGPRQDARTFARKFNSAITELIQIDNPEQRQKAANIITLRNLGDIVNPALVYQYNVFFYSGLVASVHGVVQGRYITSKLTGVAVGGLTYYIWRAVRMFRDMRELAHSAADTLQKEYEQQYAPLNYALSH